MNHFPIITGETLMQYIPAHRTHEEKLQHIQLTEAVRRAVIQKLPIGISYSGDHRIVVPANLYLQDKTKGTLTSITHPVTGYPNKMTVETRWARKAIGFDALQLLDKNSTDPEWKSFHIDRVDGVRLLTTEEVRNIFPELDEDTIIHTAAAPLEWHVKNWNWYFREFIVEREDSPYDIKVPESFYRENLQSDEKSI